MCTNYVIQLLSSKTKLKHFMLYAKDKVTVLNKFWVHKKLGLITLIKIYWLDKAKAKSMSSALKKQPETKIATCQTITWNPAIFPPEINCTQLYLHRWIKDSLSITNITRNIYFLPFHKFFEITEVPVN